MNNLPPNFDTARNFAAFPVAAQREAHERRKAFHARLHTLAERQRALPAPVAPRAPVIATPKPQLSQYIIPEVLSEEEIRVRENARSIRIRSTANIVRAVAAYYAVAPEGIIGPRKSANFVMPRRVAMYLARAISNKSFPEIGRFLGGRDHTTIMHGVRVCAALAAGSEKFNATFAEIRAGIIDDTWREWLDRKSEDKQCRIRTPYKRHSAPPPPPEWHNEARTLLSAGFSILHVGKVMGRKPSNIRTALDIDGARARINAQRRMAKAARRKRLAELAGGAQ